jgi:hypothetical protein
MGDWSSSTSDLDCISPGRRPWLLNHIDVILDTVARPDHQTSDPTPGRERFYRQHIDGRWLRVVVDYGQDPAWVVTAVEQDNDPRR